MKRCTRCPAVLLAEVMARLQDITPFPVPPSWRAAAQMDVRSITADSRTAGPGALFVAIPGSKTDGRQFIADAVGRGRAWCLPRPAPNGHPACRRAR